MRVSKKLLAPEKEFEARDNNKQYEVEAIIKMRYIVKK